MDPLEVVRSLRGFGRVIEKEGVVEFSGEDRDGRRITINATRRILKIKVETPGQTWKFLCDVSRVDGEEGKYFLVRCEGGYEVEVDTESGSIAISEDPTHPSYFERIIYLRRC